MSFIIRNAQVWNEEDKRDVLIQGETITKIDKHIKMDFECDEIDLAGKLLIPGLVDMHTHLDKAYTRNVINNKTGTLLGGREGFREYFINCTEEQFYQNGKTVLDNALVQGTMYLRSHVTISKFVGLRAVKAMLRLREDYAELMDVQLVALPQSPSDGLTDEVLNLAKEALTLGVDAIGATPALFKDEKRVIDQVFDIAKEMDADIDMHIDERDEPITTALESLIDKTVCENYQGRVTAGHCCSLSALDKKQAEPLIAKAADCNLNVVTLPSANLYLSGRNDLCCMRRGTTRVEEFLEANVNISLSSDNIRDPFRPFGNADMLEEMLLTAQLTHLNSDDDLRKVFMMGTYNPAKAMKIIGYGIEEGCAANLVVLDASSVSDAILGQVDKLIVVRNGKIVVRKRVEVERFW
jgi:cytosine deaminase